LLANEQKFVQDRHNWRRSQLAGGQSQNKTGMMPTGKNIWTMVYNPRNFNFKNLNRNMTHL